MSAMILKSMALYEILGYLTYNEKIKIQQASRLFYDRVVPNAIYRVPLENPPRLPILRGKNRLVFFYPAENGCHRFSQEDELPFERVLRVFDVDSMRLLIFPSQAKTTMMRETFMLEADGLVTKKRSMLRERVSCHLVRVWKSFVYAIGGRPDGRSERYDPDLDTWEPIADNPEAMSIGQYHAVNVYESHIYLISMSMLTHLKLWRLDLSL